MIELNIFYEFQVRHHEHCELVIEWWLQHGLPEYQQAQDIQGSCLTGEAFTLFIAFGAK